jgi:ribosomal protein S27AE
MIIEEMTENQLVDAIEEICSKIRRLQSEYRLLDLEHTRRRAQSCADCENGKLIAQPRGGVKCDRCNYWFCY